MQVPPSSRARNARLTAIFREHAKAAYRTLACCGTPDADIEDCLSQVFEIVWARVEEIRSGAERGFVCAVAARVAANARRSRRRRLARFSYLEGPDLEALPPLDGEGGSAQANPEQQAAARSDAERLLVRALAEMTEAQRDVFVLCELEELSASEAAEALGLKESAVRSRHRKAQAHFARFCERAGQGAAPMEPGGSEPEGVGLGTRAGRREHG